MLVVIAVYKTVSPDCWGPFKSEEEANEFAHTLGLPKNIQLSVDESWKHPTTKIELTVNFLLPG